MPTYSTNAKLGTPSVGDTGYTTTVLATVNKLDATNAVGGLAVTPHETPSSTSLLVDVAAGVFRTPWGQTVTYAGAASQTMTASTTTYVWLTVAGVLTTGSTWPGTAYIPLAIVVAAASSITSITDARNVCSTVVPVSQPTLGTATAGATYGTNEQTMLQAVYNLARTLGLGT